MKQFLYVPGGLLVGNFLGQVAPNTNILLITQLVVGIVLMCAGWYYIGKKGMTSK